MRSLLKIVSAAGLAMALATSAQAVPFTGTVSFGLSTLTPLAASGSGSGTSAPGLVTIATPSWAVTAATGANRITLDPTAAAPLTALSILLVAPGPCTLTGAPVGGPCALGGTANALVGGAPFLIVPLGGLGVPGRISFGPYGSWIDAQAWTAATATPTVGGSPVLDDYGVPFYTTGYDARTPGGGGVIKLVAPAGLMSTLGGDLPLFVSMTVNYAPEPGTLLLLIFSSAGLLVAGGLRSRRPKGTTR